MTHDDMKQLLNYNPVTGQLTWNSRPRHLFKYERDYKAWHTRHSGKTTGCKNKAGYLVVGIDGKILLAHRIIWFLVHGEWPEQIDHINGIRHDNRLANLRNVTQTGNSMNSGLSSRNKSGVIGVHWYARKGKYIACIKYNGKSVHLGSFDTLADAAEARKQAEIEYGYHQNHGKIVNTAV